MGKIFAEIRKENVIFEILLSIGIVISSIGLLMILMVHGTNFFEIIKKKTVNLHDVFKFFFNILFGSIINNRIENNKYYNNVETRETLNYLFS